MTDPLTLLDLTSLNDDASALVIESWRPDRGLVRVERA